MKSKLKIFYVASEVTPFAKTSGLADVAGALPKYLKNLGHDTRVMMPNYKEINERKYTLRDVIRLQGIELKIGNESYYANGKSAFVPDSKVQVYFLDNKHFFDREGLYCDSKTGVEYKDNAERFIFFSKGCLETLKLLHWQPDIIHCNDWQTALIPLFLKSIYKEDTFFKNTKTVLSIHNVANQGNFEPSAVQKASLPDSLFYTGSPLELCGKFSFLKAGIEYADVLTTLSESYARAIQGSEYGCGLEAVIKKRKNELFGIMNGIDDELWNPEKDNFIPFQYNSRNLSGKLENKKELLKAFNLEFYEEIPLFASISYIVDREGFELIQAIIEDLMQMELQFVILSARDNKYNNLFKAIQDKHPKKFGFKLGFDNQLDHLIEAGADVFLMPSRYEPCGLNQMYSLRYGTIPIVSETCGLADTVENFDPDTAISGTGFVFKKYTPNELLKVVKKALRIYKKEDTWIKVIQNGMKKDYSWKSSAQKYVKVYQKLLNTRNNKK
jgi:starch synthase